MFFNKKDREKVKREKKLEDIQNTISVFRSQMQRLTEELKSMPNHDLKDAERRIADAESFIKSTGLDKSFPRVLQIALDWHGRSERWGFEGADDIGATEVSVDSEKVGSDKKINITQLTYNNCRYKIEFEHKGQGWGDGDEENGEAMLYVNDSLVLTMRVSRYRSMGVGWNDWVYSGLDSLSQGNWGIGIVEMEEKHRLYIERMMKDYRANEKIEKAKKFT